MNLDIAIQNTLKRSEMENAMHGVMDNYGGRYQLTSYSSAAKGAEAIFGKPMGTMTSNNLRRPSYKDSKKSEYVGSYQKAIGNDYSLEYDAGKSTWTLFQIVPVQKTFGEKVRGFFSGDRSEDTTKKEVVIQRSGTYAAHRFLTLLDYRNDLSTDLKDQVSSCVITHMNSNNAPVATADQAIGRTTDSPTIAYGAETQTPFGAMSSLTPSMAKTAVGSQPVSAQSFNTTSVNVSQAGVRQQSGGLGGNSFVPAPLTSSQMGTIRDPLGNDPRRHITQGVRVPTAALSSYSNGRSL
jgi:hypothetical protein